MVIYRKFAAVWSLLQNYSILPQLEVLNRVCGKKYRKLQYFSVIYSKL